MVEEKGANLDNFKDYNREKIKSGVAGGFGGFQCCQKRRLPTTDNKNEREGEFVAKTYDVPTLKVMIALAARCCATSSTHLLSLCSNISWTDK